MRLYVGNLPLGVTENELKGLFSRIGKVTNMTIAINRKTGISDGYGYLDMARKDGLRAIEKLAGFKTQSRALIVAEAREQPRVISSAASEFCKNARSTLGHLNDDSHRARHDVEDKE